MSDELITPRLRKRLRELKVLRAKVANEIAAVELRLIAAENATRQRRSRFAKPPCGTDTGYQWHRYNEPENWPLPPEDPCGCRAGHRHARRVKDAEKRERKAV